jgi:hypothetical protein
MLRVSSTQLRLTVAKGEAPQLDQFGSCTGPIETSLNNSMGIPLNHIGASAGEARCYSLDGREGQTVLAELGSMMSTAGSGRR